MQRPSLAAMSLPLLAPVEEHIGEIALLEMRPEALEACELICRLRGISYEELFHQANEARYMEGEAGDEGDDEQGESGWWNARVTTTRGLALPWVKSRFCFQTGAKCALA